MFNMSVGFLSHEQPLVIFTLLTLNARRGSQKSHTAGLRHARIILTWRSILGPAPVFNHGPVHHVQRHVSCKIWELSKFGYVCLSETPTLQCLRAQWARLSVLSHVSFMATKQRHGCTRINVTLMRLYKYKWSCWRSRFVVKAGARGEIWHYFRSHRWRGWPTDTTISNLHIARGLTRPSPGLQGA